MKSCNLKYGRGGGKQRDTENTVDTHSVRKTDSTTAQVYPVRFVSWYYYGLFILPTVNKRARKLADPVVREFSQFGVLFRECRDRTAVCAFPHPRWHLAGGMTLKKKGRLLKNEGSDIIPG